MQAIPTAEEEANFIFESESSMHTDTDLTEEEIEASDELISEYEHNIEGSEIESSSHSPLEIDEDHESETNSIHASAEETSETDSIVDRKLFTASSMSSLLKKADGIIAESDMTRKLYDIIVNCSPPRVPPLARCRRGYYNNGTRRCYSCPAGTYSAARARRCTRIPAGYYSPYIRRWYCCSYRCGPGRYSTGGARYCSTTPAGYYSARSVNSRYYPVSAGCYQPYRGRRSSCQYRCPAGRWQNRSGQRACKCCPKGRYQPYTRRTSCYAATRGYYVSRTCSTYRSAVPAGYYNPYSYRTYCCSYRCGVNTYSTAGRWYCTKCPTGKYSSNRRSCTGCSLGYYTLGSSRTCRRARPGYYANTNRRGYRAIPKGYYNPYWGRYNNVVLTPVLVVLILQVPDLVASVVLPENIRVLGGLLVECVQEEGTKTERANLLVLLHQLVDIFLVQDISHIFVSPLDFTSLIQADGTSTNTDVLEVDILGVVQEHAHTVQKVIINRIRAVVLAILPLLVVMYLVQDDGMLLRFLVVITILTQDKLLGTDLNILLVRILLVVQDLVLVVQEVDILVLVGITVLYALKDIITLTQDVVDVMLCLLVDMPVELVHML